MQSRRILIFLIDLGLFALVDSLYWFLVINKIENHESYIPYLQFSGILALCIFAIRVFSGLYSNIWRYTNASTYLFMVIYDAIATLLTIAVALLLKKGVFIPDVIVVASLFNLISLSSRFSYSYLHGKHRSATMSKKKKINVAIIGAGQLGTMLAENLLYSKNSYYNPICFIDADPAKNNGKILGLKILYEDENIIAKLSKLPIQEIFIAINYADDEMLQRIYDKYTEHGYKIKIYDTPVKDVNDSNRSSRRTVRSIEIEDLLFRKTLVINNGDTFDFYKDKTVLVTGGGGSIGSEICRQLAKCSPKKLVVLDIYENNAYDLQQELLYTYGTDLDLSVEIASVRDRARLNYIFDKHRPDIVFHAAAHKHVPLMENSICEPVKNNVLGTYNTADMAEKYGVEKFILISTDKAVNPTNIMGASKRLCEMIVQCRTDSKTSFSAVRFGNVLGSNGSVIPLFKKQIENGGPITITDKRIIRYFMTIPEASQLVMQAGAMAKKGELFVLDMGNPVKIYDLAVNMIKLSGLTPGVDIEIEEIGLRPGEKLYEELLIKNEKHTKTDNDMIFVEEDAPLSRSEVEEKILILKNAVSASEDGGGTELVKKAFRETVPTYHDPSFVNKNAESSYEMSICE